jgi:phosphohistidine phosphatase SixA
MTPSSRPYLAATWILIMSAFCGAASAQELKGKALLAALKSGGHVVYFRHFETGQDTPDQVTADIDNCWTQRNVNAQGLRDAQRIGRFFDEQKIPVGRVVASPFCRTRHSADLAFGRYERADTLKILPFKDYTPEHNAVMKAALMPFMVPPKDSKNTIIMAHDDNLVAAGGPLLGVQGEAAVLKPDATGGFTVVGRLKPDQWRLLSGR